MGGDSEGNVGEVGSMNHKEFVQKLCPDASLEEIQQLYYIAIGKHHTRRISAFMGDPQSAWYSAAAWINKSMIGQLSQ